MNRNPASSASVAAALEDDLVVAKERKKRDKNALDYKRAREKDHYNSLFRPRKKIM